MKPAAFKYIEAHDEGAVVAALSQYGGEARLLAGGQSLVPMMNFRVATPAVLIDLNAVVSLSYVRASADELTIGAMARHAMVEDSHDVAEKCPLMHDAIRHVAHRAIRNRGTMGGSLALAYPGAEIPLILVALGASVGLVSSRGKRTMPAHEFVRGALNTALAEDEYVQLAQIAVPPRSAQSSFVETSRRYGDFALAAAAVVVDLDERGRVNYIRAAISGGTDAPVRLTDVEQALAGTSGDIVSLDDIAGDAVASIDVFGDHHYPKDYRRHLLRTALRRALTESFTKAINRHVQ
jgi:CO/xanthine dehydrogenase FAD-binding subunit